MRWLLLLLLQDRLNLLLFLRLLNRCIEHLHEWSLRYFTAWLIWAVRFSDVGFSLRSILILLPGEVHLVWDHRQLDHRFIVLILREHYLTVPIWGCCRYDLLPLIFTFIIMFLLLRLDQVVLLRWVRLGRLLWVLAVWLNDAGDHNHWWILLVLGLFDRWGTLLLWVQLLRLFHILWRNFLVDDAHHLLLYLHNLVELPLLLTRLHLRLNYGVGRVDIHIIDGGGPVEM